MTTTELTKFLPWVLPHAPGAPEIACVQELRRAAVEFCQRAPVWRHEPSAVDVVANQSEYAIPLPTDAGCSKVLSASYNGKALDGVTVDRLAEEEDWDTVTGTPSAYFMTDPDTVRLWPIPDEALTGGLKLRLSLMPSRTCSAVPSFLFAQYVDGISYGALERLLIAPGKSYSNPELAAYYGQQFDIETSSAAGRVAGGFTRAALRTRSYF